MADIRIAAVLKRYGENTIIDRLSLDIHHGEFFTLLGPSGCGKTTLLRMIAGFVNPDEGQIFIDGQDVTWLAAHKRETGMVFQDYALFPDKTVFDNVAYGLRVRRCSPADIRRRVNDILERVELGHLQQRYPGELSGGQRQRVALARALVIEPRVLLMDEPLSNLDAKLRIQMRDVIRQLQRELDITAIFVTHDQEEALSMSDRIALLRSGRVDQLDSPEGLYARPVTAYAADFIGAANLIHVDAAQASPAGVRLTVNDSVIELDEPLIDGSVQLAARPEHLSLEAVQGSRLDEEEKPLEQGVPGKVLYRRYLGFKATYAVRLPDGQIVNVDVNSGADPVHAEGAAVRLHFGPGCRLVRA